MDKKDPSTSRRVYGKSVLGHLEAERMMADIRACPGDPPHLLEARTPRKEHNEHLEFAELFEKQRADLTSATLP